jgi:hypothetical protein
MNVLLGLAYAPMKERRSYFKIWENVKRVSNLDLIDDVAGPYKPSGGGSVIYTDLSAIVWEPRPAWILSVLKTPPPSRPKALCRSRPSCGSMPGHMARFC